MEKFRCGVPGTAKRKRKRTMKIGFDNDKYLSMQSEHIRERIKKFDNKLYLEFGGKLFDDYHASRVLPGFQPDSKLQMLLQLKDQAEVVIVISAEDIISNKIRGDYGITYDLDVLRLIDAFQEVGLYVGSVCVTKYAAAPEVEAFEKRLNSLGIRTFRHYKIPGYPQRCGPHRQRRGLRQERLHRDPAPAGGHHGPRPRKRQNGHLPFPAVP